MPKQKPLLLPIDGLEVFFGGSLPTNCKHDQIKVISFKDFKKAPHIEDEKATTRSEKEELYQHAKKFTGHYKIFG